VFGGYSSLGTYRLAEGTREAETPFFLQSDDGMEKQVINDGFKMWANYLEAIDTFTKGDDAKFGRLMRVLCYYGIYNEEIADTEIEKLFFTGVKSSINASVQNIKNGTLGGRKAEKFIKPTLEEIKAYCDERKNNVDPSAFFDYYEKGGWVYGKAKTPVKDWKACVRTWERYDKPADILHSSNGESL
jgi:hypothetical protein